MQELPASSCGPLEFEGEGEPNALLVSDLPLQGGSRTQTLQMNEAIRYMLDQAGSDRYIRSFYSRLSRTWRTRLKVVGIHNYSDVNRSR